MANFNLFIPKVFEDEGFRSNDNNDPGGLTIWGLTKVADAVWKGWKIVDACIKSNPIYPHGLDAHKEELKQLAIPYYKQKYWDKVRADEIESQELAEQIVDEAVNAGIGEAIKGTEEITGEPIDGKMDNNLIDNLNNKL